MQVSTKYESSSQSSFAVELDFLVICRCTNNLPINCSVTLIPFKFSLKYSLVILDLRIFACVHQFPFIDRTAAVISMSICTYVRLSAQ